MGRKDKGQQSSIARLVAQVIIAVQGVKSNYRQHMDLEPKNQEVNAETSVKQGNERRKAEK